MSIAAKLFPRSTIMYKKSFPIKKLIYEFIINQKRCAIPELNYLSSLNTSLKDLDNVNNESATECLP